MKPELIIGKTGFGKTYYVEQYANIHNMYLIKFNSNEPDMKQFLDTPSLMQKKHASGKQIVYLFDDIEQISKSTYTNKLLHIFTKAIEQNIPIFVTTSNILKLNEKIKPSCSIKILEPKTKNEIETILYNIYSDTIEEKTKEGNENKYTQLIPEAAENCKGDIRKAIQYMKLSNMSTHETEIVNTLKAVRMIFYEKNRRKVFNYIRQIPLNNLYSWLYETATISNMSCYVKKFVEFDKMLYKLNDNYLYSYLAYNIESQDHKGLTKLQESNKPDKTQTRIMENIKNGQGCSINEAKQYLHLLLYLKGNTEFIKIVGKKCLFEKKDYEYFGITKKVPIIQKQKMKVVTSSLLNF